MVLAEAHAILEEGEQGKVVLQRLGQGHRHPRLAWVAVGVGPAPQPLDEVVLGQPHPLVGPHTVVTQVLLAVKAVGAGWVLLITGAALGLSQVVRAQQASMGVVEARGATSSITTHAPVVVVPVLVLDLLLGTHHHIQQVAEEEIRGGQGVHAGLCDGHLLIAGGAPQLQRVPGAAPAL